MRKCKFLPKRFIQLSALAIALSGSAAAFAETVAIPLGQQGKAWNVSTPHHGQTQAEVKATYGEPISQTGPVGEPPISTWEFEQFNVYFESDRVIHSVVKKMPGQDAQ